MSFSDMCVLYVLQQILLRHFLRLISPSLIRLKNGSTFCVFPPPHGLLGYQSWTFGSLHHPSNLQSWLLPNPGFTTTSLASIVQTILNGPISPFRPSTVTRFNHYYVSKMLSFLKEILKACPNCTWLGLQLILHPTRLHHSLSAFLVPAAFVNLVPTLL